MVRKLREESGSVFPCMLGDIPSVAQEFMGSAFSISKVTWRTELEKNIGLIPKRALLWKGDGEKRIFCLAWEKNQESLYKTLNSDATNNKWKSFYDILGHLKEANCTVEHAA